MSGNFKEPVSTEQEIKNLDALIGFEEKLFAFEELIKNSSEKAQVKAYEACTSLRRYVLDALQEDCVHQSIYFGSFHSLISKMLNDIQETLKHSVQLAEDEKGVEHTLKHNINSQLEDLDLHGLHEDFRHKYKFCEPLHKYPVFEEFRSKLEEINNCVEEFVKAQEENCDLEEARKFFEHQCNLLKSTIAQCELTHRFQNPRKRAPKDRPTIS